MRTSEELAKVFWFWTAILVLKVMAMTLLTIRQRFGRKVFANPEDAISMKNAKVTFDDPGVERVRRAHQNDLENIIPWFMTTFIWLGTNPSYFLGALLIRGFVLARIAHTFVYAIVPAQPWRALSFFIGYGITAYQAVATLIHYM